MRLVYTPSSLREALLLVKAEPGLVPMAGGTDLMARPDGRAGDARVLYIGELPELGGTREEGGFLHIGAGMTLSALIELECVRTRLPLLHAALRSMASPQIRNRATIGGNVMNASPAADALIALVCLEAGAVLARANEAGDIATRVVPVKELVCGPGRTARLPGELLIGLNVPPAPDRCLYEKVGGRSAMAVGIVSLAIQRRGRADASHETELSIAVGACGPRVVRETVSAASLAPDCAADAIRHVVDRVGSRLSPRDDIRSGAAYRLSAARRLLEYHIPRMLREEASDAT